MQGRVRGECIMINLYSRTRASFSQPFMNQAGRSPVSDSTSESHRIASDYKLQDTLGATFDNKDMPKRASRSLHNQRQQPELSPPDASESAPSVRTSGAYARNVMLTLHVERSSLRWQWRASTGSWTLLRRTYRNQQRAYYSPRGGTWSRWQRAEYCCDQRY